MTQVAINNGIVLYELGLERQQVESFYQTLSLTPELLQVLDSPVVTEQEKDTVIDAVFADGDCPAALIRFLKVMCRHGESGAMPEIYAAYCQYWDKLHKVKRVVCTYAEEPSPEQLAEVRGFLEERYPDFTLINTVRICPEILGGVVIRVGYEEYDWSYEGRLRQLKRALHV